MDASCMVGAGARGAASTLRDPIAIEAIAIDVRPELTSND
jgi:hypothetical protein